MSDGEMTQGGYSSAIVTQEKFVFKVAPNLHVPGAAPLLCAGITVYSPMKYYGADKKGMRIGVEGLGGLGHMAVKFGKAFGCHVTVLSRGHKKEEMALKELGADAFIATGNEDEVKQAAESLDAIIDTVAMPHDIQQLLGMLKVDGKLICVGIPSEPYSLSAAGFVMRRRMIGGSLIGGLKETQDMLDFCAEKNIVSDVEVIGADYVNEAYKRTEDGAP
jgi:8-hydroxygeraniol dehydrogenase